MKKSIRIIAVFLLHFLGFGGIYGAWMLLSDPTGGKFGWQTDLLEATPFNTYLIPGIILLIFNGVFPLFVATGLILKWSRFPGLIMLQGLLLLVWLVAQLIINLDYFVPAMHYTFFALAVFLLVTGLLMWRENSTINRLIN